MSNPIFWVNQDEAGKKAKLADNLKKEIEFWQKLDKEFADADDLLKLSENDEKLEQDLSRHIAELEESFNELELRTLFTGQYDNYNAVLAIHAGAGGTDAQDWAQMLERMYLSPRLRGDFVSFSLCCSLHLARESALETLEVSRK